MKALAPQDRPREKLDRMGPLGLGDNELLAILIGHGYRLTSTLDLANAVLEKVGGLHGLTRARSGELARVKGVGATKAAQIVAAIELGRRTLVRGPQTRARLLLPRDAAAYLMPEFGSRPVEQFGIVLLDTKHRVLKTSLLSIGSLDASVVHPREVFREAAAGGAACILLFHNHPSGDPYPSPDDLVLTNRLVRAGDVMGITVIDHVILADGRYYSLKEEKRI